MKNLRALLLDKLASYQPKIVEGSDRIPAAVLIPFFERNGEPHVVFTKRTQTVQHHRGEICFPGGSRDATDADLQFTALRELEEEIAVAPDQVEILGRLDDVVTVSSYFIVVPYIGFIHSPSVFQPNSAEVEEVLEIPFEHFYNPAIFREEKRFVEEEWHPVYYYQWNRHVIWGVTGRILKIVLDLIKS